MNAGSYSCPPIAEALVEVRYGACMSDPEIAERMAPQLQGIYDGGVHQPQQPSVELGAATLTVGRPGRELWSKDKTKVAIIADRVLSVHLRPEKCGYPGWAEFSSQVHAVTAAFATHGEPRDVRRVGVRYVNKIAVAKDVSPTEYVAFTDTFPGTLPGVRTRNQIVSLNEFVGEIPSSVARIVLASTPAEPDTLTLDIDVFCSGVFDLPDLGKRIEELRTWERQLFEAVVTDRARTTFAQGKD